MKKFLTIAMIIGIMVIGFGCAIQSSGENKQPDNLVFIGEISRKYIYEFEDAQGREFIVILGSFDNSAATITQIK